MATVLLMTVSSQVLLVVSNTSPSSTIQPGLTLVWDTRQPAELGRSPTCALHLPDVTVSRRHIRLLVSEGRLYAEALTENNGTFLDGRALEPGTRHEVTFGSHLQTGGVVMAVKPLQQTLPVVQQLEPQAPQTPESSVRLRVVWDASQCTVELNGQLLDLPPLASKALGTLAENAGEVVHQWDLRELLGAGANLPQIFSQVRSAFLVYIEQESLSLDQLRVLIRVHSSGSHCAELDDQDARGVLRHFVASRRGHGYRICLARTDVEVVQL